MYVANNPFVLPLWAAGLVFLFFNPAARRFRLLGWMFLAPFVLFYALRGRGYYVAPAYAMLVAGGAVWWETWLAARSDTARRLGYATLWALLAVGSVAGVILVKPLAPINSPLWEITSDVSGEVVEMIGWPDLAAQVAEIYTHIPDDQKSRTVILAGNYGEAGAFDLYGPQFGLPPVISGANSLWQRGYGDPEPETVIVVGFERQQAGNFFNSCQQAGKVTNRYGVKNEETSRHTGLYICRQPRRPWPEMWKTMQWFQ